MKKIIKSILYTLLSLICVICLVVGGYIAYLFATYNRIEDSLPLDVKKGASTSELVTNKTYSLTTYNLGFGAYSQNYTFFMDEGYELDGSKVVGKSSRCASEEEMHSNITNAIKFIKELNPDFAFFQEVDTSSTRSFYYNQNQEILDTFSNYDATHAINFHTKYLPYPFLEMHGIVNGGITTLSRYPISNAMRKSFTVSTSVSKFFDLDRCFSIQEISVANQKKLYLVNVHMSAYDEGGVIRKAQRDELNAFLNEIEKENNYVIVGGDFNHDLLRYNPDYNYNDSNKPFAGQIQQLKPDWLQFFFEEDGSSCLSDSFHVYAPENAPTCRDADVEWEYNHTYVSTIDGFIVSNNIQVQSVETQVTQNGNKGLSHFAYSDHDPVLLSFSLL